MTVYDTINGMIFVVLGVMGLVFGSFVNATVWRLHEQEVLVSRKERAKKTRNRLQLEDLSILQGRSMCTHCHHQLTAADLIPVFSYIWLRGRCRYCHKPIQDTPLAELLVPVVFIVSYIWWPYTFTSVWSSGNIYFYLWLAMAVGFVILALYDVCWLILPDKVVFPLIGLAFIEVVIRATVFGGGVAAVADASWGAVCLSGLFWVLYAASRGRWIGFGDVKLAVAIGLLVGGPINAVLVLFIASLVGTAFAVPLLARRQATATTRLPFGPLLIVATIVVMLFGSSIAAWYGSFLVVH